MRGLIGARRRRGARPRRDARSRDAIRASTGCASSCRCCRRWPPTRRGGTGGESGFQTSRAQMFRAYPRAIIPRAFAGWDDYEGSVGRAVASADVARLHVPVVGHAPAPALGHGRDARDGRASRGWGRSCGLAALVHGLALHAADGARRAADAPREALMESSFRAGRDGLDATVCARRRPAAGARAGREALDRGRPFARELGAEAALEEIERILPRATAPCASSPPTSAAACRRCWRISWPRRPRRSRPGTGAGAGFQRSAICAPIITTATGARVIARAPATTPSRG